MCCHSSFAVWIEPKEGEEKVEIGGFMIQARFDSNNTAGAFQAVDNRKHIGPYSCASGENVGLTFVAASRDLSLTHTLSALLCWYFFDGCQNVQTTKMTHLWCFFCYQNTFGHKGGEIEDHSVTFRWTAPDLSEDITFV